MNELIGGTYASARGNERTRAVPASRNHGGAMEAARPSESVETQRRHLRCRECARACIGAARGMLRMRHLGARTAWGAGENLKKNPKKNLKFF